MSGFRQWWQVEKGMYKAPRDIVSDKRDLKLSKVLDIKNKDVKLMQLLTDLSQYKLKIEIFIKEYEDNPNNWVLESNYNEKLRQKEYQQITLKL
jgi:hypothetical protein